jgi:hypothetical protein
MLLRSFYVAVENGTGRSHYVDWLCLEQFVGPELKFGKQSLNVSHRFWSASLLLRGRVPTLTLHASISAYYDRAGIYTDLELRQYACVPPFLRCY